MACSSNHPAPSDAAAEDACIDAGGRAESGTKAEAKAPQWMLFEVADGLQRLMYLALPGTPAAEMIEGTARAWTDAFWYAPRIAAAFQGIGHRLERFPTPKAILEAMPDRSLPPALPEPKISEEQRRANLRRMAQIMTEALKCNKAQQPPLQRRGK